MKAEKSSYAFTKCSLAENVALSNVADVDFDQALRTGGDQRMRTLVLFTGDMLSHTSETEMVIVARITFETNANDRNSTTITVDVVTFAREKLSDLRQSNFPR